MTYCRTPKSVVNMTVGKSTKMARPARRSAMAAMILAAAAPVRLVRHLILAAAESIWAIFLTVFLAAAVLVPVRAAVPDRVVAEVLTPLIAAARKGHMHTLQCLLDHGGDVTIENDFGRTALHVAAIAGHVEACLALLHFGADLYHRDKNECTPLCRAVVNGQKAAAVALASAARAVLP